MGQGSSVNQTDSAQVNQEMEEDNNEAAKIDEAWGEAVSVLAVWADKNRICFQVAPFSSAGHVPHAMRRAPPAPQRFHQLHLRAGESCLVRAEEGCWVRAQLLHETPDERGLVTLRLVQEKYDASFPADQPCFARDPAALPRPPRKRVLAFARLSEEEEVQTQAISAMVAITSRAFMVRMRQSKLQPGSSCLGVQMNERGPWGDLAATLGSEGLVYPTYARVTRQASNSNQMSYLSDLVLLILLRSRRTLRQFELAALVASAGVLGDCVIRHQLSDGRWETMFIRVAAEMTQELEVELEAMLKVFPDLRDVCPHFRCLVYTPVALKTPHLTIELPPSELEYPDMFFGAQFLALLENTDLANRLRSQTDPETFAAFLDSLVIAPEQPSPQKLRQIMMQEIDAVCSLQTEDAFSSLQDWVREWLSEEEGTFLGHPAVEAHLDGLETATEGVIDTTPRSVMGNFHNRVNELSRAHALLQQPSSCLLDKWINSGVDIAITGPPGVGKTELALKIVESQAGKFHHTLWIEAHSENAIHTEFFRLADRLKLATGGQISRDTLRQRVYQVLSNYRCLYVMDNALSWSWLRPFLPSLSTPGSVVMVTSVEGRWPCALALPIHVFNGDFLLENLEVRDTDSADTTGSWRKKRFKVVDFTFL